MQTHFHTGNNFQLLFKRVIIDSTTDVILACVVTCAVTVLYEGLRCLRVNIVQHHRARNSKMQMTSKVHLMQTALYLTELMLAYFLMLAAMTYNIWLFLAVPLGALIGFQLCTIFSRSHLAKTTSANATLCNNTEKCHGLNGSSDKTGLSGDLLMQREGICKVQEKNTMKNGCHASESNPDEITELMTSI